MSYEVQTISHIETLPLRQRVLKPYLKFEECVNPGDDLNSTFHLGVFKKGEILSIASFYYESHLDLQAGCPYRLRGMATSWDFQKSGLGRIALKHGIEKLKSLGCDLIWCNARENAYPFYQSLGFDFYGDSFELPNIGPHKVMYKRLNPR